MFAPVSTPHLYVPYLAQILGYSTNLNLYIKDESRQRGRSIKGRVAYAMAMRSRDIDRPIIESSSGNLALGLGYWCGQLGAPRPLCLIDDCCERSMIDALHGAGCLIEGSLGQESTCAKVITGQTSMTRQNG
jgi:cysteine synthase